MEKRKKKIEILLDYINKVNKNISKRLSEMSKEEKIENQKNWLNKV